MGAKLRVLQAESEPVEIEIANTATIGRRRDSTVCLNTEPLASRQHAMIRCYDGYRYQIIDFGSRNGTYVDGKLVVMPVPLEDGMRICIGDSEILFMQEGMAPTQEEIEGTLASTISDPERLRTVSLLLCDIRGFSTMAEMIPSSDLAQILGEWFRKAGNMIQDSGGVIDKFIGDAILAYWTKHEAGPNECEAALKAGEQLLQIAETVKWPIPAPDFDVVVALHCGDVACSNIGLVALRDATVIGDAVNTVCRIEPLIKQLGRRLVASKDFLSGLRVTPPTIDLGEHSLKGKRRPVQLFAFQ